MHEGINFQNSYVPVGHIDSLRMIMHIAASKPRYISEENVDKDVIDKEKEIYAEQSKAEGKPDKVIDKIVGISPTLIDYNVKAITGGTDALGEVSVRLGDGENVYTGRGASLDIVEASVKAYIQAMNKLVYFNQKRKKAGNLITSSLAKNMFMNFHLQQDLILL